MLLTYPSDLEIVRYILQSTFESFARPHEILDVVDAREPDSQKTKEICFLRWKWITSHHFKKVTKVVSAEREERKERRRSAAGYF